MREIQLKDTNKATLPAVLTRFGRKEAVLIWALHVSETHPDAEFRTPHNYISGGENDLPEHVRSDPCWVIYNVVWSRGNVISSWRRAGADPTLWLDRESSFCSCPL